MTRDEIAKTLAAELHRIAPAAAQVVKRNGRVSDRFKRFARMGSNISRPTGDQYVYHSVV